MNKAYYYFLFHLAVLDSAIIAKLASSESVQQNPVQDDLG